MIDDPVINIWYCVNYKQLIRDQIATLPYDMLLCLLQQSKLAFYIYWERLVLDWSNLTPIQTAGITESYQMGTLRPHLIKSIYICSLLRINLTPQRLRTTAVECLKLSYWLETVSFLLINFWVEHLVLVFNMFEGILFCFIHQWNILEIQNQWNWFGV